ncbi:hypothetical protein R1flu_027381 [Riccia fluitans]|uniref:Uncharacterized protein n=1 Tax=Riccia fluitans TaxID=41844 RepID=A0ABD1XJD1_9MARC
MPVRDKRKEEEKNKFKEKRSMVNPMGATTSSREGNYQRLHQQRQRGSARKLEGGVDLSARKAKGSSFGRARVGK